MAVQKYLDRLFVAGVGVIMNIRGFVVSVVAASLSLISTPAFAKVTFVSSSVNASGSGYFDSIANQVFNQRRDATFVPRALSASAVVSSSRTNGPFTDSLSVSSRAGATFSSAAAGKVSLGTSNIVISVNDPATRVSYASFTNSFDYVFDIDQAYLFTYKFSGVLNQSGLGGGGGQRNFAFGRRNVMGPPLFDGRLARFDETGVYSLTLQPGQYFFTAFDVVFSSPPPGIPFTVGGRTTDSFSLSLPGGVPEPASWAMLVLGFGLIGGMARGRREFAHNSKTIPRTQY